MPASAADATPSAPPGSLRGHWGARLTGLWPSGLVAALVSGWVLWLLVVLTHPLHPTSASALLDASHGSGVERWAFVEPSDSKFDPLPALVDPVRAEWNIAAVDPRVTSSGPNTARSQSGWVAWKDSLGTHVARLDDGTVTVAAAEGSSIHVDTSQGWPIGEVTLGRDTQVHDVGALWNGDRLLGPMWLMPGVSLLLAVLLLQREPRFRTRWGWFWLLGAPLGLGFVWMLLREQWFGTRQAPATRPGGWTGLFTAFLLSLPAEVILSGIVPRM